MVEKNTLRNSGSAQMFERLHWHNRQILRFAALMTAMSGFMREDSDQHPDRAIPYAIFVAMLIVPVPFVSTVALAGAAGACVLPNPWSQKLKGRLLTAFNAESLEASHKEFMKPDSGELKHLRLAMETGKRTMHDSAHLACKAWESIRNAGPRP
jgi:hypothetical protein